MVHREIVETGRRDRPVRMLELPHPSLHLRQVLLVGLLDRVVQIARGFHENVPGEVRDEVRIDRCAVVVGDGRSGGDHGRPLVLDERERREAVAEKEVADAAIVVEADDLRDDRKRRIVDDRASRRVVCLGVVLPRPERADDGSLVDIEPRHHPVHDRIVDVSGREAVVSRVTRLELVHEFLVGLGFALVPHVFRFEVSSRLFWIEVRPLSSSGG